MSQVIFDSIDPSISGTDLADVLNDFKDAVVSGFSGTSRPTELQAGGYWVDMTNNPTSWSFKIWTGTDDVEVFTVDLGTGLAAVALAVDDFQVKKISADANGALLELVKQRVATNGQVKSGDVVGEIRMIGRTDSSTNPVVAKIIFTSTDDNTTSAYGGTLSFYSTPDASATLTEHMRFINGLIEAVVPLKLNALILAGQNVATAATIAQLSATQALVEFTGSTATDLQGVNSGQATQEITLHNRSSAIVTLKHQNGTANAADRLQLPNSVDYLLYPDATVSLYYCTTTSRWKILSTSQTVSGFTVDSLYGITQSWTAPNSTSAVKIRAFRAQEGLKTGRSALQDVFGNAFAWGANANGQLGLSDVTPRSSPVVVVGGVQFIKQIGESGGGGAFSFGISSQGIAYAWGVNTNGQLGLSNVTPISTPTAIGSGFKFINMIARDSWAYGLTTSLSAYSMGANTNGQLGVGDTTPRSVPTAVLGGLRFAKLVSISGASANGATIGLTNTGIAYAWGLNANGNLGVGADVLPRSSPVAVLGGLTFANVGGGSVSGRYFFIGLTTGGLAYAWGSNTQSNLGNGDQVARSSPVAVLGGLTFKRLFYHEKSESVFGLTTGGQLYAWGDNTQGVLGVGDTTNRSSPVAVLGGLTFAHVVLHKNSVYALTSDGTAYAWGSNANGQLGVGDVVSRSSPVAVLGGLKFSAIRLADGPTDVYSVYGSLADGSVYSWGANSNGTLGLGDVTPRSSPVAVLGGFANDSREQVQSIDLTVTGGSSYTVTLGAGIASFGSTPIGQDIARVEIEYLQ